MKLGLVVAIVVGAVTLGAGGVFVAEQLYWSNELKVQLAEKDRLMAGLRADIVDLTSGLDSLQQTNAEMQALIEASLTASAEVARSNQSSVEKVRSIIGRLQKLQEALRAQGVIE